MNVRIDMLSGIGWLLFHTLHEQYKDMPGEDFLKLFEKTHHCKVYYRSISATENTKPMRQYYLEFTPEQFTLFQLKYGDHPQGIIYDGN